MNGLSTYRYTVDSVNIHLSASYEDDEEVLANGRHISFLFQVLLIHFFLQSEEIDVILVSAHDGFLKKNSGTKRLNDDLTTFPTEV